MNCIHSSLFALYDPADKDALKFGSPMVVVVELLVPVFVISI